MVEGEIVEINGKKFVVKDRRKDGFYCIECGRFSDKLMMDERGIFSDKEDGSTLVYKRDYLGNIKEVWRVYSHYDGCYGWE